MKAVEEPACLSVGTDVSAKYRGAFCEAKIKTVKRLVKVKVNLKAEGTSQVVQDDQVKGPLRVGSVVEVKTTEGGSSEAVISKLTDASLYTVVFDDGDEKTLRRTSLCLKGERHFAESETLDQLPLTNPEHFGTPVIGKKSNRGRRSSQAVADEENESSSSEEEDEERRIIEELLGKVCSVDGPEPGGLVLVVSPGCNEELQVKKDHCLVRSFADGKFSTASHRNLNTLGSTSACKLSNRTGAEAAQSFLRSGAVPNVWKMDLSQILESSSDSDDKHSEEEQEGEEEKKRKATAEAEPEEELDPEERDHFLQQLYKFMEDRATPINKPPVLGYKDLNLFKLFRLVTQHGGYGGIESGAVWKQIYMDLGIPVLNSAAAYNVKTAYRKYLFGFEEYCRSALITFRTIHHNNPRSPDFPASPTNHRAEAEHKGSPVSNQRAAGADLKDAVKIEPEAESESDSEREELLTSSRGRRRCVIPLKDEQRDARKRMPRQNDQSEHTPRLPDQSERGGRFTDQSERGSEDEDDDDEDDEEGRLLNPTERGDSDPEADSLAGTRVRVKYGRGKTQKIYEAHIKKTDNDNGENFYLVHYYGWNVRYDEWVKADRIIWPSEKGSKKKRGKLKNKDEPDGDEERLPKGPGRRGRPLGSKNKSNGRSAERREPGTAFANGDTPRRRTRRTSGMFDSDRASNEDSGNSSDDSESEDSTEKKPFPWRQAEAGLKQEVDRSPEQEEEEPSEDTPDTTPPSERAAPGQSQPRAEPDPAVTPERKDAAPSSDAAAPKLKLPLMVLPPRSEPMVLLHHCLPPDSDTDSASESDSERDDEGQEDDDGDKGDANEGVKGDANEEVKGEANGDTGKEATEAEEQETKETQEPQETKDTKEEVNDGKDVRTEEEPDKNISAKSPLRHANLRSARSPQKDHGVSARSPQKDHSARSPQKDLGARSPQKDLGARSPQKDLGARSPQKDLGARSPQKDLGARSPQKDLGARSPQKDLGARSPQKDLGARSPQKDLGARSPQKDLGARSPQKELGARSLQKELGASSPQKELGARSPQKDLGARSPQKDLGARSPQKDLGARSPQKDLGARSPQKDLGARSPQKDLGARSPQKDLGARSPQKDLGARSPQKDLGARSPQKELGVRSPHKDLGARSPQKELGVRSPQKDHGVSARSPQKDLGASARSLQKDLGARSPKTDLGARSPQKDLGARSLQKDLGVRPSVRSPPRDKLLSEKRPAESEVVWSPRRLDKTPQETSPKPEENPLSNAPDAETSQTETTPTKPDTNAPGNSPKPDTIEPETSPNRGESGESGESEEPSGEGNTPPLKRKAPEQKTPDKKLKTDTEEEELKPAEEESGENSEEAESVPEMGVDALVCHEVDLDEPDEREKVSASEQLLLMRESHLLRAPPPQEAHHGEPPRGGQRHEDSTANGDRGQKRVLEGPHSPTVKKHKRPSHKRLTPNKPDKNGAGHSSDSEDQSHKHCPSPTSRGHKWTLHIDDLEKMSSSERISFLQDKLQEIRKYYLSLKSEVASIDRRRKRLKKKEREVSNTASASSSSDAAMSPSSSSPSQSSLAVEVR